MQQHYSKTAIGSYENMIKRYLATTQYPQTAGYADVVEYIGSLRKLQLHAKSLRNHLFAIKIYYKYLIEEKIRSDHPCNYLYLKDRINKSIAVESLYSVQVLEGLLKNHKAGNAQLQNRDEVVITLLIYQALTVLEITELTTNDIDLEQGIIKVKGTVKNKARTLSLKPVQVMLFYHYLNETRMQIIKKNKTENNFFLLSGKGEQMWTGSINRIINKDRHPDEKLLPIKIRQSVVANYLKQHNDVRIVQVFAGHRRAGSTEEYKQSGLEELKANINKLHPLQ